MPRSVLKVALLLCGSGACSLIYETVWLRELRLIFGASTMASAAVVACFVGGLGAGGILLGKRADSHERPLEMYSMLEGGIAVSSAVTPFLLMAVRAAYIALGGTHALGYVFGSVVRLLFAAIVFAIPTLLMGGTLAAASRAIESEEDRGRRNVAMLYGANTLGAVAGCMASTFLLFEVLGTRLTLWAACLVNALVAVLARSLSRSMPSPAVRIEREGESRERAAPAWFTLSAAGIVGFVFCLMELVWYRMLGPLLGGTVFSFGLILAIALLGIGLGGIAYAMRPQSRAATVSAFAWTCLLEAAFVAIPYALGDRLAILAAVLHPLGGLSFALQVSTWALVTSIVVLPAACMSGVQFPLLIGMLGPGREGVGRDVGTTTATNSLGAIAGSLAGGFGLIPMLSAPGCWRLVVWLLLALGFCAIALEVRRRPFALTSLVAGAIALACLRATGPTAAWRHSPIGAGRVDADAFRVPSDVRAWENGRRRAIGWEVDGRESSVALDYANGLAFVVNGKVDGNARTDAATPVMLGLLGSIFVNQPARAMVIGLGTGETAGWLGAVDTISTVDVAELEPAIIKVARQSELVNHHALENPKVHVQPGDARELLLTSRGRYDVIASEPSNPYRAGVASLFTREYYEAIASRLDRDGVFIQWIQGYEVDGQTIRTVIATLASVFGDIEIWELAPWDLAFVAADKPIVHDLAQLRARLTEEPYRSATGLAWRTVDVEGFLSHFVASGDLAREVAKQEGNAINVDDDNLVEFGFARSLGTANSSFAVADVRRVAGARGFNRPRIIGGPVDWDRVDDGVADMYLASNYVPPIAGKVSPERAHRLAALRACHEGNSRLAVEQWREQSRDPIGPTELALVASAAADIGDERALDDIWRLREYSVAESDAIVAHLDLRRAQIDDSAERLGAFFAALHSDPWPMDILVKAALRDAGDLVSRHPPYAERLFSELRTPFALHICDSEREEAVVAIASHVGARCVEAYEPQEPNVPWDESFLKGRLACYREAGHPNAARAEQDLREWFVVQPIPFGAGF